MSTSSLTSNDASQTQVPTEEDEYEDDMDEYFVALGFGYNYFGVFGSNAIPISNDTDNSTKDDEDVPPGTFVIPQRTSSSSSTEGGWKMATKERELNHWSCGGTHTVGLNRNGEVSMMGTLQGHVTKFNSALTFPLPIKVVELASGRRHSLGLLEHGIGVVSWGSGYFGQLGHGPTSFESQPRIIDRLSAIREPITSIAAGAYTSAAILNQRVLFCWGSNRWGQCNGRTKTNAIPLPTPLDLPFVQQQESYYLQDVSLGQWHGVLRTSTTTCNTSACKLWVWGKCQDGMTSRRHKRSVAPPTLLSGLDPSVVIIQMVSGINHSLFLSDEGNVYSWGSNADGQLGLQSPSQQQQQQPNTNNQSRTSFKTQPHVIEHLPDISFVQAAGNTSMAISTQGHLYTWGYADAHQLGHSNGTLDEDGHKICHSPTKVSFLSQQNCKVQHVSCGPCHTLVYCKTTLPKQKHKHYSTLSQTLISSFSSNLKPSNNSTHHPTNNAITTTTSTTSQYLPLQHHQQHEETSLKNSFSKPKFSLKRFFCKSIRSNKQSQYSAFR